jgi:hypothetical protein
VARLQFVIILIRCNTVGKAAPFWRKRSIVIQKNKPEVVPVMVKAGADQADKVFNSPHDKCMDKKNDSGYGHKLRLNQGSNYTSEKYK